MHGGGGSDTTDGNAPVRYIHRNLPDYPGLPPPPPPGIPLASDIALLGEGIPHLVNSCYLSLSFQYGGTFWSLFSSSFSSFFTAASRASIVVESRKICPTTSFS